MNYEDLTERQKKNLEEFLRVTKACDKEQLAAIDHLIPMTQELFERCLDTLIAINAFRQIECLMQEFPDLAKECGRKLENPEKDIDIDIDIIEKT